MKDLSTCRAQVSVQGELIHSWAIGWHSGFEGKPSSQLRDSAGIVFAGKDAPDFPI